MQSDVTLIKQTVDGNMVTMPLFVYEEMRAFCRMHGDTSLPGFVEFIPVDVTTFSDEKPVKIFRKPLD